MRINVRVQPRSSREKLEALGGNDYKAYLTSPPVDGKANKALVELIAKSFDVAKSRVEIVKGERSRNKIVEIASAPLRGASQ